MKFDLKSATDTDVNEALVKAPEDEITRGIVHYLLQTIRRIETDDAILDRKKPKTF